MDFGKPFEEFWRKEYAYSRMSNRERMHDRLKAMLSRCDDVHDIDEYVFSLRSKKKTVQSILLKYFKYLEGNGWPEIQSRLKTVRIYDVPFERQLEIAKYLHEPKTNRQIEEEFGIDERTCRNDLQELQEGIEVLGTRIQIERQRKNGEISYRSTLHPVFLPLNLTEVYAMTGYLENKLDAEDPNSEVILEIVKRIKSQLSDYAFEKLFPEDERPEKENDYIADEEMAMKRENTLMYLLKSGQYGLFLWKGKEYRGRFELRNGEYTIRLEDGSLLEADISDIILEPEKMEYE